jgi:hypothetical protein
MVLESEDDAGQMGSSIRMSRSGPSWAYATWRDDLIEIEAARIQFR